MQICTLCVHESPFIAPWDLTRVSLIASLKVYRVKSTKECTHPKEKIMASKPWTRLSWILVGLIALLGVSVVFAQNRPSPTPVPQPIVNPEPIPIPTKTTKTNTSLKKDLLQGEKTVIEAPAIEAMQNECGTNGFISNRTQKWEECGGSACPPGIMMDCKRTVSTCQNKSGGGTYEASGKKDCLPKSGQDSPGEKL